jgi:hypothetical protein
VIQLMRVLVAAFFTPADVLDDNYLDRQCDKMMHMGGLGVIRCVSSGFIYSFTRWHQWSVVILEAYGMSSWCSTASIGVTTFAFLMQPVGTLLLIVLSPSVFAALSLQTFLFALMLTLVCNSTILLIFLTLVVFPVVPMMTVALLVPVLAVWYTSQMFEYPVRNCMAAWKSASLTRLLILVTLLYCPMEAALFTVMAFVYWIIFVNVQVNREEGTANLLHKMMGMMFMLPSHLPRRQQAIRFPN